MIDGKDSLQRSRHMARYGHRDWIWWVDKHGQSHAARKTPQTVKAMLLETGTRGDWALVSAKDGCPMKGFWEMGLEFTRLDEERVVNVSNTTISTFQLFEMFPDEATARKYLESRLWPNGAKCPVCKQGERVATRKDGYYRCNPVSSWTSPSEPERSSNVPHVPLHKWVYAMYLCSSLPVKESPRSNSLRKSVSLERLHGSCSKGFARRVRQNSDNLARHREDRRNLHRRDRRQ